MKSQLLCTFALKWQISKVIQEITQTYNVIGHRVICLQNENNPDQIFCVYNVSHETQQVLQNTIKVHRKKESNTLYTINSLNRLIQILNNGQISTQFNINWVQHKNVLLLLRNNELLNIKTRIYKIFYIDN